MSSHQAQLCRDLVLEKQHRCSYTGGKAVYSRLDNNWIACLNNEEITLLSTTNGEIIMNTNALGECIQTLSPLSKSIKNAQEMDHIVTFDVSLNDKLIAIATRQNFIRIIQIIYDATNTQIVDLQLQNEFKSNVKSSVRQLIFSATNNEIIGGTGDGSVFCWNISNGFIVNKFIKSHFLPITVLKMNPNKHYELVSGSMDTKIKCYNLRNHKVKTLQSAHKSPIIDIEFVNHQNDSFMISVAMKDCITLWDMEQYQRLRIIDSVYSLTNILALKNTILLCDESGFVHFYALQRIKDKWTLKESKRNKQQICQSSLTHISAINQKNDIMITSLDCNFHFASLREQQRLEVGKVLVGYNDEMLDIEVLSDKQIVIASNSSNLKVFDSNTMHYQLLIGHSDTIMGVTANHETGVIASASKDKTIRYWKDYKCIAIAYGHKESINCIAHLVDDVFISGAADGEIKAWQLSKCLQTFVCHEDDVNSIAVSHQYVVSGASDCKITLYKFGMKHDELQMKSIRSTQYRKGKTIWCVAFSKNDELIASSHNNGEIRLWNIELKCVKVLQSMNGDPILDLLFINYSTQIMSSTANGIVSVWTLKDNECIKQYKNHYDKIWRVTQLEENKYISIGCDSILNIWKDQTMQNEKDKLNAMHEIQINKTKINNCLHNKQYGAAIKLCLQLDEPQKLFGLLLSRYDEIKDLDAIIMSLDYKELSLLITYLIDFNTASSKYAFLCQSLLNIIYSNFDIDDLLKLQLNRTHVNEKQQIIDLNVPEIIISQKKQNFAQLNSALIAYSTRHLKRVDNLLLNLSIIDSLL